MDQDAKPEVTISYVIKASFFINQMPWEVVEDVQIKGCLDIKDLYKLPKVSTLFLLKTYGKRVCK